MKKSILKKLIGTSLILTVFVLLDACYPQGAEFVDELDLVITAYDDQYDFGTPSTYAINDEIPMIGSDPLDHLDGPTTATILTKIRANMASRGYTEVDVNDDPDLYMPIAALEVKTTVVGCGGGGWWGYYPGWGYPGYGGCWYPVGYSYSTGSIFITLWDKDSLPSSDNDPTPPVWEVGINGLLQGSESSINTRIQNSIDQAFEQSIYIQSDL